MPPEPEIRTLTADDVPDWLRAVRTGFLQPPVITEQELEKRRPGIDLDRTQGAFDAGHCVATFRSFAQELTAVGGTPVPADAISNVTVSPTHRRRGLLSRMMAADLAAAKERGDVVATLISAEYPIYGWYGFGPAARTAEWEVDVLRSGLDPRRAGPDDGGRIDLVDAADVRKEGPALHERLRAVQHGAVNRDERWWQVNTGAVVLDPAHWTEPFYALYRAASGETEGYVVYRSDDKWGDNKQPGNTATVADLIAATPAAERALWQYVCSIDWITKVRTGGRAPDDLLPDLLPDPRAARIVTVADWLWVRILDVVRALESRTYAGTGTVVLDVTDRNGLAGGRFRLDASPEGASCTPTEESAELSLDIGDLGSLWLADESAVRLTALGRIREERPGASATLDALMRTSRRAWCPDMF
ncbi:GNAT family N-acetyltransferase [Streptomyces sp. NPDC002851]